MSTQTRFEVWKTIKLGTVKNVGEILKILMADGNYVDFMSRQFLRELTFKMSETEQNAELVNVTVAELGFRGGACYADICTRASGLELYLCPPQFAFHLCLQLMDQPRGTYADIAMKPLIDSGGKPHIFSVGKNNNGKLFVNAVIGKDDFCWEDEDHFVFLNKSI